MALWFVQPQASLFSYDMARFADAEPLYYRSIKIGLELFGPSYSGLEYDFRGLINMFEHLGDWGKRAVFQERLVQWEELRAMNHTSPPITTVTAHRTGDISKVADLAALSLDDETIVRSTLPTPLLPPVEISSAAGSPRAEASSAATMPLAEPASHTTRTVGGVCELRGELDFASSSVRTEQSC
jgi:hypothetical protein